MGPHNHDEETGTLNEKTPLVPSDHHHDHHGHDHGHEHSHHDDHNHDNDNHFRHDEHSHKKSHDNGVLRRLKTATVLCLVFMTVEVIGGYIAGSLAVLSDAAHLMADLASFAVAIVAAYLAARPSTRYHTYGLKRTESLAALFSMSTLAVISIGLALEAVRRIYNMLYHEEDTEEVDGKLMSGIATIGVLVNLALAAVLGEHHVHMPGGGHSHDHGGHGHDHSHDHHHQDDKNPIRRLHSDEIASPQDEPPQRNVNLQAAYLHVLADLAQSVAVLIAGLVIWWKPEWKIVDPCATILFCVLVFYSTLGVIRASVCVLLEEVPPHISWTKIHDAIVALPGVEDVHDLHVWSISQGINAMSVHLRLEHQHDPSKCAQNSNAIIERVAQIAKQNGIVHSTVQVQHTLEEEKDPSHHSIEAECVTCVMGDESQSCVGGV